MKPIDPKQRRGSFARARSQLGRAVGVALSGSLEAVAGKLRDGLLSATFVEADKLAEAPKQRLSRVLLSDRRMAAKVAAISPPAAASAAVPAETSALLTLEAAATAPLDAPLEPVSSSAVSMNAPVATAAEPSPEPPVSLDASATAAAPPLSAATPPATSTATSTTDDVWEEPIRTRSMARLLAGQGHPKRALAIYAALLASDSANAELRAEAEALRSRSQV